jgi:hypothetical protein
VHTQVLDDERRFRVRVREQLDDPVDHMVVGDLGPREVERVVLQRQRDARLDAQDRTDLHFDRVGRRVVSDDAGEILRDHVTRVAPVGTPSGDQLPATCQSPWLLGSDGLKVLMSASAPADAPSTPHAAAMMMMRLLAMIVPPAA